MNRDEFRYFERLRVRWAEVDMQKIVFNGNYMLYIDTAVGGYWRALAIPYVQAMQGLQGDLYMRKATLEYHGSAQYDDVLDIGVRCARLGNSSMTMQCSVFKLDRALVTSELIYVFADPSTQTPKAVPQSLRDVMQGFESGKPMVEVRVGLWTELGCDAERIRSTVFIEEQGIPQEMEWDEADAACTHAVAYNKLGQPLATGRLLEHVPGVAKIGRMAVVQAMRGSGVGRAVLDALMKAAREHGYREAVLHAQTSASSFYGKAGFAARGPVFDEVGIPHIEMTRAL